MMDTWPKAGAQTMFMKKKKRYKLFEKMFEKKGALDGWQGMCSRFSAQNMLGRFS